VLLKRHHSDDTRSLVFVEFNLQLTAAVARPAPPQVPEFRKEKIKMNKRIAGMRTLMLIGFGLVTMVASAEEAFNTRFPLHFVVSNPPCPKVAATLTGDAEVHQVFRSTKNDDGTYRIDAVQVLQGTATDSDGNRYVFHDIDHFVINGSATAPQAKPPYIISGTGKVALISLGKAPNIRLNMFINLQVNADGSIVDLGSVFEGDITCDPSSELGLPGVPGL
jgi:hypothetical protein